MPSPLIEEESLPQISQVNFKPCCKYQNNQIRINSKLSRHLNREACKNGFHMLGSQTQPAKIWCLYLQPNYQHVPKHGKSYIGILFLCTWKWINF